MSQQSAPKSFRHKLLTRLARGRRTGHDACLSDGVAGGRKVGPTWFENPSVVPGGTDAMAEIAYKQKSAVVPTTREHLRALDDAGIVESFLGGDERAFQELVERYQTRLLNFIYRTIGDRERAEDLVQEVFIRVYRHLHRFDRSKKFSTWVYTIASNLAKNELRNRSRNPLVLFQTIK